MPTRPRPRRSRFTDLLRVPALIRRLEQLTGPLRLQLGIISITAALAGFAEACVLIAIARVATNLSESNAGETGTTSILGVEIDNGQLLLAGAVLIAVSLALQLASGGAAATTQMRSVVHVRDELLDAHAAADWPTKEDLSTSEFVQLAIPNAAKVGEAVQAGASFATSGAMFVSLLVSALLIDPVGALAIILGVAILLGLTFPLIRLARRMNTRIVVMNKDYASAVHEYAAIGREVQIFGVQVASTRTIRATSRTQATESRNARRVASSSTAVFKSAALLLILCLLAVVYVGEASDVASYAAISLILLRSVSYGQALQSNLHSLAESGPWLDDLIAKRDILLAARLDSADTHSAPAAEAPAVEAISRLESAPRPVELELRGVRFAYGSATSVFEGFDLAVPAGQYLGVVGPSGVGKSTLAELVLGLREPDDGVVLADAIDLSTIPRAQWSRRTAFVPQEPVLIHGSVLDNVRFFRDWISDEQARSALASANVLADLSFLPDGLETEAGSLGSRLSGGQKQRIAIARALADHPSLIVLDEPTSALDPESEARITDTLDALRGSTTVLVIAHRWTTLTRCDRVVALGREGITADASPDEVQRSTTDLGNLTP